MSDDERAFVFKVCVVGNGAVGKTSLIKKFTEGEFDGEYIMTLGAQFTRHQTEVDGTPVELIFWDIAGQQSFAQLQANFYKGSRAAIVVFSQEDNEHGAESFKDASKWLSGLKKNCGELLPIIVFGNKIDLVKDPSVKKNDIDQTMKGYNFLGYYSTSALSGQGVNEAFGALSKELFQMYKRLG